MSTKLSSLTLRAKENPKYKFRALAYLINEDFLKWCFKELKKDRASGVDGVSYGDKRPYRSCHNALDRLNKIIMTKPINFVVDMDIEKFFDSVNHNWLMECLRQRIKDTSLLRLIKRFLKMGIMEGDRYIESEEGVPQGGVLSPMLANIYLHYILDLWFERKVKKRLKGYAGMVRYADDFIVCFQAEKEAKAFRDMLKQRLGKFGLRIARDKSRIIEFGRYVWERAQKTGEKVATFDFLGFTHYCDKTILGKFKKGCILEEPND